MRLTYTAIALAITLASGLFSSPALAQQSEDDAHRLEKERLELEELIEQHERMLEEIEIELEADVALDESPGLVWVQPGGRPFLLRQGELFPGMKSTRRYEVAVRNGETTVKIDGKTVSPDRWRRTDSGVEILSKDGSRVERMIPLASDFAGAFSMEIEEAFEGKKRPMIGVKLQPIPPAITHHTGIGVGQGVIVGSVVPGKPAQSAGIQEHDIVTHIDGQVAAAASVISKVVLSKSPGDVVTLTVMRGGTTQDIAVEVGEGNVFQANRERLPILGDVPMLRGLLRADAGSREEIEDFFVTPPTGDLEGQIMDLLRMHEQRMQAAEEQMRRLMEREFPTSREESEQF